MPPQNINEIYAVIEVVEGNEKGIMGYKRPDFHGYCPLITRGNDEENKERMLKIARELIEEQRNNKIDISGMLVKFTNREVISVFGGEI